MSQKRVLKALMNLGLSQTEAQVFIHLAIEGPQKAGIIAEGLRMQEHLIFESLQNLQSKGVVGSEIEQSLLFFALPLDKALELLMKGRREETQNIEQNKYNILSKWQTMIEDSTS